MARVCIYMSTDEAVLSIRYIDSALENSWRSSDTVPGGGGGTLLPPWDPVDCLCKLLLKGAWNITSSGYTNLLMFILQSVLHGGTYPCPSLSFTQSNDCGISVQKYSGAVEDA